MTPLTDAELDALVTMVDSYVADGWPRVVQLIPNVIAELREHRAKVSLFEGREQFSLDDFFTQADEIRELTEQIAALVAALARIGRENCRCGCRRLANLALVAHQDAALASARGDA